MTSERYGEVLEANEGVLYHIYLTAGDILMLHGGLSLIMQHPKVKAIPSESFQKSAEALTETFHTLFERLGFTKEEIEDIDKMVAGHNLLDEEEV